MRALMATLVAILKFPFFLLACALWAVVGLPLLLLAIQGSSTWLSPPVLDDDSPDTVDRAQRSYPRGFVTIWEAFYARTR